MNRRQQKILRRIKQKEQTKSLLEAIAAFKKIDATLLLKPTPKTYRFEIEGFCEIDITAESLEKAEDQAEKDMEEIFNKDLFTNKRYLGIVDKYGDVDPTGEEME